MKRLDNLHDGLIVTELSKRYGEHYALRDVSLEIPQGAFVCFVGPSGCGKTTLLRILAGLLKPDGGSVFWKGRDFAHLLPEERGVGMVFQSAALFPHLSVGQNIAFGLRVRGAARKECLARVDELLGRVRLPGLADRAVGSLSGGQRQRVAIARALAPEPDLFLLDEPFSALDVPLRESLQIELASLHQRLGLTSILVTHDREEALSLADYLVVMDGGRIQQVGNPRYIYSRPANPFVASFLGGANLLPGAIRGNSVSCGGDRWSFSRDNPTESFSDDEPVTMAFLQERAHWSTSPQDGAMNCFAAKVTFVRDGGSRRFLHFQYADTEVRVVLPRAVSGPDQLPKVGERGWLTVAPEDVIVYKQTVANK
jgi:putative spermidine/putrescine transport system ATP-binding protein